MDICLNICWTITPCFSLTILKHLLLSVHYYLRHRIEYLFSFFNNVPEDTEQKLSFAAGITMKN